MQDSRVRLVWPTDEEPFSTGDIARKLTLQYGITRRSAEAHASKFCRDALARGELDVTIKHGRRYYTWRRTE